MEAISYDQLRRLRPILSVRDGELMIDVSGLWKRASPGLGPLAKQIKSILGPQYKWGPNRDFIYFRYDSWKEYVRGMNETGHIGAILLMPERGAVSTTSIRKAIRCSWWREMEWPLDGYNRYFASGEMRYPLGVCMAASKFSDSRWMVVFGEDNPLADVNELRGQSENRELDHLVVLKREMQGRLSVRTLG